MSCLGGRLCLVHGLLLTGGRSFETGEKVRPELTFKMNVSNNRGKD